LQAKYFLSETFTILLHSIGYLVFLDKKEENDEKRREEEGGDLLPHCGTPAESCDLGVSAATKRRRR